MLELETKGVGGYVLTIYKVLPWSVCAVIVRQVMKLIHGYNDFCPPD